MYALVDGNNFYVSCERVFRPSLLGRPVIVLSNNDGCAIARSNEAKELGITMGSPWFQIQQKLPDAGVIALSANFTLYGDMSDRMTSIAAGLGPEQEIYSIDECFIGMAGVRGDLVAGIGPRITEQLAQLGIHTALDIARMDPRVVRKRWSVVLERTVREIQGQPCIDLEEVAPAKKEIAVTRSFGRPLTTLPDLIEAVTAFASRAGEKLRKQEHRAGQVLTFIHTSSFRKQDRQYARSITVPLRKPSCDSAALTATAVRGLRAIFRPGFNYAKAGVMLLDLQTADVEQGELDLDDPGADRTQLMETLDNLNDRYGRNTVSIASGGVNGDKRRFSMKRERKTPDYTTRWEDVPVARAC